MRSKDARVRLSGFGRPEQWACRVARRFVEAPQVMPPDQWLARRGQPQALPPPEDDPKPS
jgi:hypothetical protein